MSTLTLTIFLVITTSLIVKIYEKSYVGATVTPYIATNVSLVPNATNEDPIASIISAQLNVSFIISDQDDYDNFPDLLNFDETKYYVELVINNVIKWRGFLLNDYIQVPFTTGNQDAGGLYGAGRFAYSINDRGFKVFQFNPLTSYRPSFPDIEILDVYHEVNWYAPKLKNGQMLAVPLNDDAEPDCVYFVKDVSRNCEIVDYNKAW